METETMMEAQNGPVGEMLEINSAGKYEVQYVPPNNELYSIVPVICGQFFAPADYYSRDIRTGSAQNRKIPILPGPIRKQRSDGI